jgi:ribosomal 50S subunit-associated protein YjgA (DUF615 family)
MAELLPSWWLTGRASAALIQNTARKIQETQQDNAKSRRSHIKRTRRKLRDLGITLTTLKRCEWNTS